MLRTATKTQISHERIATYVEEKAAQSDLTAREAISLALRLQGLLSDDTLYHGAEEADGDGPVAAAQSPAVPIEQSVQKDFIVCLETGARLILLRRHLANRLNLTPEQYREKWGLPVEYPMAAGSYSETRGCES